MSAADPEIVRFLTDQFGAKVITGETDVLRFKRDEEGNVIDRRTATNSHDSMIAINQHWFTRERYKDIYDPVMAYVAFGESGELYEDDHMIANKSGWVLTGKLNGKFFGQFTFGESFPSWLRQHENKFIKLGLKNYYNQLLQSSADQLERYRKASQK